MKATLERLTKGNRLIHAMLQDSPNRLDAFNLWQEFKLPFGDRFYQFSFN